MSLKQQIESDIKKAILGKQKDELTALRAIKSAILLAETEKGAGDQLTADVEMKLLTKAAKQRKDSADLYREKGRDDLADKEMLELEVINRYLPKQLTDDELKGELEKIIADTGASSPKDMGKVMGLASKALAGKAEGKRISEFVKQLLNN
ncbi:MAG: GatB/YqeY domain-containing protein [Bacteroidota bacterium]